MSEGISLNSLVVAVKENLSCALGEETAILQMRSGVYYGLDPVGARLWSLLDKPRTVEELRETLVSEYDVQSSRCEEDLFALLAKMQA
jgi:hypothetical protein